MKTDILVIGGGSAGLSSALVANSNNLKVTIVERETKLGGILKQCIHNGFGLKYFKKEMTGPEYAQELINKVKNTNIEVLLETSVLSVEKTIQGNFSVEVISPKGKYKINCKAIILAMGCRERPAAAISLCGTRPAGILTAGAAQKIINIDGKMIGKRVVIVGSGDVGLIMARRLHFEGAEVLGVYEISSTPSGLNRNIVQCLNDYNIPLHLSETVMSVVGEDRVEGVFVAKVNPDFSFDLSTKKFIKCDTVLLSVGLVPENDLVSNVVSLSAITNGAVVDDHYMTNCSGIFSCGNVLHVHDIVDDVTFEAELAGKFASEYCKNKINEEKKYNCLAGNGIRYVVPQKISSGDGYIPLKFRANKAFRNCRVVVKSKETILMQRPCNILLPAQMEQIIIDKSKVNSDIIVEVE